MSEEQRFINGSGVCGGKANLSLADGLPMLDIFLSQTGFGLMECSYFRVFKKLKRTQRVCAAFVSCCQDQLYAVTETQLISQICNLSGSVVLTTTTFAF